MKPVLGILCAALLSLGASQEAPSSGLSEGFSERPLTERRELVAAARSDPGGVRLEPLLACLGDADPRLRADLLRLLAQLDLSGEEAQRRVQALERRALSDPSLETRRAALESLGTIAEPAAAQVLLDLCRTLAPGERAGAALQLTESVHGRALSFEAVREAFQSERDRPALSAEALAVLLASYGRTLAEREGGGDLALDRAPFVLGDVHPEPAVRSAAGRSLDQCLARLRELERHERADRLLEKLASDGMAPRQVLFLRTRAALAEGGVDPQVALFGARQLARTRGGPDAWTDQRWRFRARYLEGIAQLALGRPEEAGEALEQAGDLLDGLLEQRGDLAGPRAAGEQRDLLLERSLVDFAQAFGRLAGGARPDDLFLLETLRRAHQTQLEAQLVATAGDAPSFASLDTLFDAALSPYRLVFAVVPHEAWPPERALELEQDLDRALASVCARELPGFEPFPDLPGALADPVQDPRRSGLLEELGRAELAALERRLARVRAERLEADADDAALEREQFLLAINLRRLGQDLRERDLGARYFDLRLPASASLRLAAGLRREGRNEESRRLAESLAQAMQAGELSAQYPWAVRIQAQARMAVGGAWTDEGEADLAEEEMLKGLALFEELQTHYTDRGAPEAAEIVEADVADALVSLAVNANVKAGDAERALEYFERAYAIAQDDFMSIMLACYRARSGREAEARALLAEIPESPRGYYNLCCTYALLGDHARALELLERDFEENRRSAGALEKQKAWAREDPDLASLREDPLFQALTAPSE
jgi:tetratricopeptide (TPR) repeat protein